MERQVVHLSGAARAAGGLIMAVAISAMAVKPASATFYDWTLSGGSDSGSGFLTTGATDNGGFDIMSFGGQIDGATITGLLGGQPGVGYAYSPSGAFYYDNILYPSSNSAEGALLDLGGILFTIAGGEGNIWGTSASPDGYSYWTYESGRYVIEDSATAFSVVDPPYPVPEPAPAAMVGLGLLVLWLARSRRVA